MCKEFLLNLQNSFKGVYSTYYRLTKGLIPTCTRVVSLLLLLTTMGVGNVWGDTYSQLTSIASIDESAEYVLGIDETGFHYSGTSSWGLTALPSSQTPIKYKLTKAADGNSFTAQTKISNTTYYLQIPTSNTFSMATSTGTNTDIIIGTTQVSGTNYAVANKTTTNRHLRINGTSGLRSYASTTGSMAFFYKVIGSFTITAQSNNNSWGTVSGTTTITASPSAGYRVSTSTPYTISPANSATVTNNGDNTFSVTPSANTTITINFESIPIYTVSFSTGIGNPSQANISEASGGAGISLPAGPTPACSGDGWSFAGWSPDEVTAETGTAPTTLLSGSTTYYPTSNTTLYAVYQKGDNKYYQLSSAPSIIPGRYVVVNMSSGKALAATPLSNYYLNVTSPTISGTAPNKYITSPGVTSIWDVTYVNDKWVFYNYSNSSGKYLYNYCNDGTHHNVGLKSDAAPSGYTITFDNGFAIFSSADDTGAHIKYLYYNNTTHEFTGVASSDETNNLTLFRLDMNYYSSPTCCTPLASINGSVAWSNAATAVVTWDNIDHVSSWTVKYKTHAAGAYTTWAGDQSTAAGRRSVTITGLTPCTNYDFQIIANPASGYCDKDQTIEDSQTHNWTVTSTGVTHATASPAIPSTTCSGFSTTISPATGYALPADITVTNASKSWNSSTGALSISSVTGNVSITITPTCVSPNITGNPADATYYQGDTPSDLTVTASLSSGTLSYQWEKSTDGGSNWSNVGTNSATLAAAYISTASTRTTKYRCTITNASASCSTTSAVATITVNAASYFPNRKTLFFEAASQSNSAWDASACVKAWFRDCNENQSCGEAASTYWLTNNGSNNTQIYAAIIPSTGNYPYMTLQRFDNSNCTSLWNNNGAVSKAADGGSNVVKSVNSGNSGVSWSPSVLHLYLQGSPDGWISNLAEFSDQNDGVWTASYNNYTPSGTSATFKIHDSYNNWHGNWVDGSHPNEDAVLSGMIVGSTYNVTATYSISAASTLVIGKTFVSGTVHFDKQSHGGAGTIADLTNVAANATISAPSAPTDDAYDFGGWFKEPECENAWNFASDVVDETMTLYAKWTIKKYAITYAAGDYGTGTVTAGEKTHGEDFTLSSSIFSRDHYTQDGWSINSNGSTKDYNMGGSYTANAAITLYPHWTADNYTVSWIVNDATYSAGVDEDNNNADYNTKIGKMPTAPADNTLNNCANKFMGWSTHSWGSTPKTTGTGEYDDLFTDVAGSPEITENTTFYAVFAETEEGNWELDYSVETALASSTAWGSYGTAYDYTALDGGTWTIKANKNSGMQINNGRNSSIKIPHCPGNIETIEVTGTNKTVRFSQSNYDGSTYGDIEVTGSDDYTQTLNFSGKNLTDGYIVPSSNANAITHIIVYYRSSSSFVTECASNQVRVTYDANGGSAPSCASGVTTKNASYTVCSTEPIKDYYTFIGWNDGTSNYSAGATYNLQNNTNFTAQWTPTTYNITYELNGGTNDANNPATYNFTTATITLEDPTKGHDRFDGWYATYSEGVYSNPVTEISRGSHEDITLYAKWAARYEIIFDADGLTTTIYRAGDEDLSDAVAGQGSVPSDPSAPSSCSSKTFVGWSENTINGETDTRPSDLTSATGTVGANKHYYAVWATASGSSGTMTYGWEDADATTGWTNISPGTSSLGNYVTAYDGSKAAHACASAADTQTEVVMIQTVNKIQITAMSFYATKEGSNTSGASWVLQQSDNGSSWEDIDFWNASSVTRGTWTQYALDAAKIEELTSAAYIRIILSTASTSIRDIDALSISYDGTSYSAYATSCCLTKVTLNSGSPSNGTVTFIAGDNTVSVIGTCDEDKEVTMIITPDDGYQLTGFNVATGDGKIAAKTTIPAVVTNSNSSAEQDIILTFAEGTNGAYDVTATFDEMIVSGWIWKQELADATEITIPETIDLYVGQQAKFILKEYIPNNVLADQKGYSANYINDDLAQDNKAGAYYITRAKQAKASTTLTLTSTSNSEVTKEITIRISALPSATFIDNVHNESFSAVTATIDETDKRIVYTSKKTPIHEDLEVPISGNACELQHLHLIGWIDGAWTPYMNYMNGTGTKPTKEDIIGATGYFYLQNADINLVEKDGHVFYAIWAIEDVEP